MKCKIYPVIHVSNMNNVIENVEISRKCGCEGVFLIHMQGHDEILTDIFRELKIRYPDLKIGINRLSKRPSESFDENNKCGANFTWMDNCGISDGEMNSYGHGLVDIKTNNPSHKIFAGIAFKYQKTDNKPIESVKMALENGYIVTTTGMSTGNAPDVKKIIDFSNAVGRENLAIASGITPENIKEFVPYCEHFLVATGISLDFYRFDIDKLSLLVKNASS